MSDDLSVLVENLQVHGAAAATAAAGTAFTLDIVLELQGRDALALLDAGFLREHVRVDAEEHRIQLVEVDDLNQMWTFDQLINDRVGTCERSHREFQGVAIDVAQLSQTRWGRGGDGERGSSRAGGSGLEVMF